MEIYSSKSSDFVASKTDLFLQLSRVGLSFKNECDIDAKSTTQNFNPLSVNYEEYIFTQRAVLSMTLPQKIMKYSVVINVLY